MFVILYIIFFNFFVLFFFGRFIGGRGVFAFSIINFVFSFFYSLYLFYSVFLLNITTQMHLWTYTLFAHASVSFILTSDSLSVVMFVVVLCVSGLVHYYSIGYMRGDPYIVTFFSFLSLFTFFMLVLVSSSNFVQLFFGWEGIGLCSYLLIGFWSTRLQANRSALKAIVINRVGDVSFMLGLGLLYSYFLSIDFSTVFVIAEFIQVYTIDVYWLSVRVIDVICFCFTIAAIAKSAQIGLHMWLPDAMEGPTPVSALIHAATMVTAGIFLLNRISFMLIKATVVLDLITYVGSITIIFAASCALYQNDIKKIIAYSTCSQLGYMFLACGLTAYNMSFFHLVTHAVFKALLFLSAGSVIHSLLGEQDVRRMGALHAVLPITYVSMAIGSLALMGLPFLAGFYSKEAIIFMTVQPKFSYVFALFCSTLGAILTSLYSIRLLLNVFYNTPTLFRFTVYSIFESNNTILVALSTLCILSVISGFVLSDLFIGFGSNTFVTTLALENLLCFTNLPYRSLLLYFFICSLSIFGLVKIYYDTFGFTLTRPALILFNFLSNKWYFDYFASYIFYSFGNGAYTVFKVVDRAVDIASLFCVLVNIYRIRLILQRFTFYAPVYMNLYVVYSILFICILFLLYM